MAEIIPFPGSEQVEEPQAPAPHVIRIVVAPPAPAPSALPAIITIVSLLVIGISIGSLI